MSGEMESLLKFDFQTLIIISMFSANLFYYKFKIEKLEKEIERINQTLHQVAALIRFLERENEYLNNLLRKDK